MGCASNETHIIAPTNSANFDLEAMDIQLTDRLTHSLLRLGLVVRYASDGSMYVDQEGRPTVRHVSLGTSSAPRTVRSVDDPDLPAHRQPAVACDPSQSL